MGVVKTVANLANCFKIDLIQSPGCTARDDYDSNISDKAFLQLTLYSAATYLNYHVLLQSLL